MTEPAKRKGRFDRRQWASQADRRADGTFTRHNFGGRRDQRSRDERREQVRRLLPVLGSCRKVARALGVNEETVRQDTVFLGLKRLRAVGAPENRRRSADRSKRAQELYEAGLSMEKVAHELGISER